MCVLLHLCGCPGVIVRLFHGLPILKPSEAYATERVNFFCRGIYQHDVFVPSHDAKALGDSLYIFIKAYLFQANAAFHNSMAAFPLVPKLHAVHQIAHQMRWEARRFPYAMNPATVSCSMDEDFVGRCAALSRCVSPMTAKTISKRTLQRYLSHLQILWARR